MLRSASDFRIPPENWNIAKEQARAVMIETAKMRGMITYSDLVSKITAVKFLPHDTRLFHLLGQISVEENQAGRGMLSAVVVHKYDDMQPGEGFFVLGEHLGFNTKDVLKFWVEQLHKVHAFWSIEKTKSTH